MKIKLLTTLNAELKINSTFELLDKHGVMKEERNPSEYLECLNYFRVLDNLQNTERNFTIIGYIAVRPTEGEYKGVLIKQGLIKEEENIVWEVIDEG